MIGCSFELILPNHKGGLRNRILPLQLSVQSIRQQHKYLNLSFPAAVHRLLSYALWELSYRWASDNRRKSGFQPYNKWLHYHIRLPNHRADSQKNGLYGPPFVSIFHKEIGSKAGVDKCSRWYLEFSVTLFTQRQVKVFCPHHHRTVHLSSGITTINITMLATCTQFMATMP